MSIKLQLSKFDFFRRMPNVIVLSLVASAALVLAWIGWITWNDISVWNKDLGAIFFGSRTGEGISLGIGMTVIHYVLIGTSLLAAGVVVFLRNHILATEPEKVIQKQVMQIKNRETNVPMREKVMSAVKSPMKTENAAAQEERFFSGCLHHFGYLSSRPKDSPIPQECIICQRLGDCMVATVYVKKVNE